jgi:ribosomal protein L34E
MNRPVEEIAREITNVRFYSQVDEVACRNQAIDALATERAAREAAWNDYFVERSRANAAEAEIGKARIAARAFLAETGDILRCFDCGRPYGKGPDLVVSDADWARIAPRPPTGGVLCPNCMSDRFEAIGAKNVHARFTSGPFAEH